MQPLWSGVAGRTPHAYVPAADTGVETGGCALLPTLQRWAAIQPSATRAHSRIDMCAAGSGTIESNHHTGWTLTSETAAQIEALKLAQSVPRPELIGQHCSFQLPTSSTAVVSVWLP